MRSRFCPCPIACILGMLLMLSKPVGGTDVTEDSLVTKIAFGSCAKQDREQPIWDEIVKAAPDVFIFLGDNIYGDTEDMELLRSKWALLKNKPGYTKLRENARILATWDDHDYGVNDGGIEYPKKVESKAALLDFLDEPADTARRKRDGIYASYLYGPPGKRLQIIILDLRWWRSPLKAGPSRLPKDGMVMGQYVPNDDPGATMLGETQWAWLEEQLRVPAELRLIGCSTQFLVEFNGYEAWANLPLEREKMFNVIRQTRANGVLFISGDTHWAELSREERDGIYPMIDFTSSGLTQTWHGFGPNRHRVGKTFGQPNFGWIEIDWNAPTPTVALEIRDQQGVSRIATLLKLEDLRFND